MSSGTISAIIVGFKVYDVVGTLISDKMEFHFLDAAVHQGESFGDNKLVRINAYNARKIEATVKYVVYDNGNIWRNNG